MDIGASHHVTNDVGQLQQSNKYHGKTKLTMGDGNCLPIHHTGTSVINSSSSKPILLKNVIHAPQISRNRLSVSQHTAHNNLCVEFDSNSFTVKDKTTKKELLQGKTKHGLYHLEPISHPQVNLTSKMQSICY